MGFPAFFNPDDKHLPDIRRKILTEICYIIPIDEKLSIYKIGKAKDLKKRLFDLSAGSVRNLKARFKYFNDRTNSRWYSKTETLLHNALAPLRIKRELFYLPEDILEILIEYSRGTQVSRLKDQGVEKIEKVVSDISESPIKLMLNITKQIEKEQLRGLDGREHWAKAIRGVFGQIENRLNSLDKLEILKNG